MVTPQTLPTFEEACDYLSAYTNYERVSDYKIGPQSMGTERMELLLEQLQHPEMAAPALHITGTKGKGSTALMTAAFLQARGLRVGVFTSPHLESLLERIQVQGVPILEERFCQSFARVLPVVEEAKKHPTLKPPTFFEILTALAFVTFQEEHVDVMVMEVGLGGRLDATNVSQMNVVASAITPISLDHTRQLGDDLVAIATEKGEILRSKTTLILAPQTSDVELYLHGKAAAEDILVRQIGADMRYQLREEPPHDIPEAPMRVDIRTWRMDHDNIAIPYLGEHQLCNVTMALGLTERYLEAASMGPLTSAEIDHALTHLQLPARCELVDRSPYVLLDGAHNPASAWVLSETLSARFGGRPCTLVFAAAADKDIRGMLRILAPLAQTVILTSNGSVRGADPEALREFCEPYTEAEVIVEPDIAQALQVAHTKTVTDGVICVTGSLYLAGSARQLLRAAKSAKRDEKQ